MGIGFGKSYSNCHISGEWNNWARYKKSGFSGMFDVLVRFCLLEWPTMILPICHPWNFGHGPSARGFSNGPQQDSNVGVTMRPGDPGDPFWHGCDLDFWDWLTPKMVFVEKICKTQGFGGRGQASSRFFERIVRLGETLRPRKPETQTRPWFFRLADVAGRILFCSGKHLECPDLHGFTKFCTDPGLDQFWSIGVWQRRL